MPPPRHSILNKLRVAFTLEELRYLESIDEFRDDIAVCDGSPQALEKLITHGSALLARRDRRKKAI